MFRVAGIVQSGQGEEMHVILPEYVLGLVCRDTVLGDTLLTPSTMSISPCKAIMRGVYGGYSFRRNLIWPICTDFLERKSGYGTGLV